MAWPKSFGRKEAAKRAIAERGWNPLNYNLLLKPEIVRTKPLQPKQQQPSIESTSSTPGSADSNQLSENILSTINTTSGIASDIVDLLVLQEMKNCGRREAIKKRRSEQEVRQNGIKKLSTITGKLTSGILGVHEHFTLDSDVHDAVSKYYKERQETENKKKARKQSKLKVRNEKYKAAKTKDDNNQTLNRSELTVLLSRHRMKDDPPAAKTIGELRRQWESRRSRLVLSCADANISFEPRNNEFSDDINNEITCRICGSNCTCTCTDSDSPFFGISTSTTTDIVSDDVVERMFSIEENHVTVEI